MATALRCSLTTPLTSLHAAGMQGNIMGTSSRVLMMHGVENRPCWNVNGSGRKLRRLSPIEVSIGENPAVKDSAAASGAAESSDYGVVSIHHVGFLCENLEKSLEFYQDLLGLKINEDRPHNKLPYRGAWLWVGSEMIHLMELPNPDPLTGRPEHGGRDRHACIAIKDVSKLKAIFDKAGISYTLSRSGRPAIFARDPDGNALEFTQVD